MTNFCHIFVIRDMYTTYILKGLELNETIFETSGKLPTSRATQFFSTCYLPFLKFFTNQMSNTATEPKGKMDFDSDFGVDQNKSLRRPWVAFFHFFFRITALVVYLFGSTFSGSFIGVFVTVILLLSLDFWTVKNISGRILVWTTLLYFVLLHTIMEPVLKHSLL